MKRTSKRPNAKARITRNRVIAYGIVAAAVATIGYFGWYAMIPANGTFPVFTPRENHFIKATHSSSGYHYVSISSGSVKGVRSNGGTGIINPEYMFSTGEVQSIHLINEDIETHSQHNLNIDALNVHTNNLNYYEGQSIDFITDKAGTFEYYCSIHPEMKGKIVVEGQERQ
jgi:hypothetical protein